jgi:hypothetical protein
MTVLQEDLDFLEHVGIKGMKWGVRRNRRAELFTKRANHKANLVEKAYVQTHLGVIDRVRGRGTTGGAKRKGERLQGRNSRVQGGEASVVDMLLYYGTFKYKDLVPVRGKNKDTKDRNKRALSVVVGAGLTPVAVSLARYGAETVGKALV